VGKFFSCESYVLKTNRFQIELIANLDKVPEAGALLVYTWPKPKAGPGFPARLFAILP
jgi:kynurenine formamidase